MSNKKINLEGGKKEKITKTPFYINIIFFLLLGLTLLFFVVYYITFMPVPSELEFLKEQALTVLELEDSSKEAPVDLIIIIEAEEAKVYSEPDEESEIITEFIESGLYEKVNSTSNWVKIQSGDKTVTGWIENQYVEEIIAD